MNKGSAEELAEMITSARKVIEYGMHESVAHRLTFEMNEIAYASIGLVEFDKRKFKTLFDTFADSVYGGSDKTPLTALTDIRAALEELKTEQQKKTEANRPQSNTFRSLINRFKFSGGTRRRRRTAFKARRLKR